MFCLKFQSISPSPSDHGTKTLLQEHLSLDTSLSWSNLNVNTLKPFCCYWDWNSDQWKEENFSIFWKKSTKMLNLRSDNSLAPKINSSISHKWLRKSLFWELLCLQRQYSSFGPKFFLNNCSKSILLSL